MQIALNSGKDHSVETRSEFRVNNVGLLRLVFASAVIVGHSPELVDGNRTREPLARIFGTITLGSLAVDAFFVLSGFLITQSWLAGRGSFVSKRLKRIYPGFVVAYLISVFGLGSYLHQDVLHDFGETVWRLLTLREPIAYPGSEHAKINLLDGAMWTISYEARCYLLTAILGLLGFLRRRRWVVALTVCMIFFVWARHIPGLEYRVRHFGQHRMAFVLFGDVGASARLVVPYLCGMCFCLYWEHAKKYLNGATAAVCFAFAVAALFTTDDIATIGLSVFGGAALFWLALKAKIGPLQRINASTDISYGTYLYGWPALVLALELWPGIEPVALAAFALPVSLCAGWLSWHLVERPFLRGIPGEAVDRLFGAVTWGRARTSSSRGPIRKVTAADFDNDGAPITANR